MSKDKHSFNVEVAKKYSIDVAIFLESVAYWVHLNMANSKHHYDDRFWTRNTLKAFEIIFPYWTSRQLERVINTCMKEGLLLKENYNKHGYDRTAWYTLSDLGLELYNFPISPNGEMQKRERGNAKTQTVTTIPITNTVTKKERKPALKKSLCPKDQEQIMSDKAREIADSKNLEIHKIAFAFMRYAESEGWYRTDWKAAFVKWLHDEKIKPERKRENYHKNEPVSTVKFWGEGHPDYERQRA